MPADLSHTLVIGVSSRVLFDLEESNRIFQKHGFEAYLRHQRKRESEPLGPGVAFPLVKALLGLNEYGKDGKRLVDVIVTSSNHPDAGLRIMNSIAYHKLDVARAAFTGGADLLPYLKAFEVDLLLSKSPTDVQQAVDSGVAAALMYAPPKDFDPDVGQIRLAFDGDAVIFSDDSEKIYKEQGLEAFQENERRRAKEPMAEGPFARLLRTIHALQEAADPEEKPFRIALVTARGSDARERVIRTLRAWDITMDEAYFLNGAKKDGVLAAFRPHIFFDDQDVHVGAASKVVPAGRVPNRSDGAIPDEAPADGESGATEDTSLLPASITTLDRAGLPE